MQTPITVESPEFDSNIFKEGDDKIEEEQANAKIEFDATKMFLDDQLFSSSAALRTNSIASIGSQMAVNYEVFMPAQQELKEAQDHYLYLQKQQASQRQLSLIALKQQHAQNIAATQQLADKLNLEVGETAQTMESSISTMLNVYNNYQDSINNLVLAKGNVAEQQKVIEAKKQSSKFNFWHWLTTNGATIGLGLAIGAFAGGKALGKIGSIGAIEGEEESGLAANLLKGNKVKQLAGKALSGGLASKGIGSLLGGVGAFLFGKYSTR